MKLTRAAATVSSATGASVAVGLALGLATVGAPALLIGVWLVSRARAARRCRALAELPTLPVALVLGAQMHPGGRPSDYLRARLDRALELYRAGKVERFITSGDDGVGSNHESTHMADYLVRHGVPTERITVDPAGYDTYASCLRARDVYGVTRLVVVSQSYHLPRALLICRRLGLDAWGYGDRSVRHLNGGRTWRWGVVREIGALPKVARDLLSRTGCTTQRKSREATLGLAAADRSNSSSR